MRDEQRLAEIRARADATTPGPWVADREEVLPVRYAAHYVQAEGGRRAVARLYHAALPNDANAAFVAAARDDLPWLLDLVQQQAGVIADLAEESDAARLALRYREALEWIADLNIHKEGLKPAQFRTYALDAEKMQHVAREALEGKS